MTEALRARHELHFTYHRSVGGAERLFLTGLARAMIVGSVDRDGRVTVPPVDWDPETGDPVDRFVRVADTGVVRSWTWVFGTDPDHPLPAPPALALVQLDGADTSLVHAVAVDDPTQMRTGMRVQAEWNARREGSILDIRAFVPCAPGDRDRGAPPQPVVDTDPARELEVVSDVHLHYNYEPGLALSSFLAGLAERRITGGRCASCAGVYVPPHSTCPVCRAGPMEPVELADTGSVTSYTVVHVPFHGMTMDLPFVCAWIRLDGADVPFAHLIGKTDPGEVRVGCRVQAVWAAEDELAPTWESIRYFRLLDHG